MFNIASIFTGIESGLKALPGIVQAVQGIKAIGHSKESTLQKITQIVEISAAAGAEVGSLVPNPQVQAVSALVGQIVEEVFAAQGNTAAAAATT